VKSEIYTCDVCGVQKKESNHWFRLSSPQKLDYYLIVGFHLFPWSSKEMELELHICSSECAHKKLEEFLSK
jgi:hypothetical protein